MEDIAEIIQQFGFPILAMLGLGYFVYFVWTTITEKIDPATEEMKMTVLKFTVSCGNLYEAISVICNKPLANNVPDNNAAGILILSKRKIKNNDATISKIRFK